MTKQKRTVRKFLILTAIVSLALMGLSANPAFSTSWSSSNVSNNISSSINSSVAVDKSGTIHVVWEEEDTEIYYSKSSNGASWSPKVSVSRSPSASSPSRNPKIAVAPDGSLSVVWVELTTNWEIFYSQFKSNTWSTPVNVSSTSFTMSDYPRLAIDAGGKIHVAWQDNNEVAYSSSNDGQTWLKPNVILTSGGEVIEPPALSAAGNNVHLVWGQQHLSGEPPVVYFDIRYRMYNGSTGIWGPTTIIAPGSTTYRGYPAVASDTGGKPHAIWVEGSTTEIYYSRLEGTSWITPFSISNTTTASGRPSIAADGAGNLHAAWEEVTTDTDHDIYYSRFNGGSWSYRENVLDNADLSQIPSIAADGAANPNIVWQDSGSGNGDIFFARATGSVTIFSTGFENAPWMNNPASGWEVGDSNASGTTAYWKEMTDLGSTWDTAYSGSQGAWCAGVGGDTTNHKYRPYMNAYARTSFDLTYFKDATLTFWYRFDAPNETTDLDFGVLNIILNGDSAHPIRQIFYQDMAPKPWTQETVDLTSYGGRSIVGNKVTLEWRWVSDENTKVGEGMYIDDILVTGNAQDQVAPSAVSNLAASSPTLSSLNLSWAAPGDDGSTGTATTYDIRYFTSPIDDSNWASAMQASGEPAPKLAGSSETFTVTGLNSGTTYYFAIKTADEAGNWSYLSNIPSASTSSLLPGDINKDGRVSLADLAILAAAYGTQSGDPNYNPDADLNGDGRVSLADLAILAANYGRSV